MIGPNLLLVCWITVVISTGSAFIVTSRSGQEKLNQFQPKADSFTFKMRGCRDIYVILHFEKPKKIYEMIVRGYNGKRSFIRRGRILVKGPKPLRPSNCGDFVPYWMSWDGGVLACGYGSTLGDRTTLSYRTEDRKMKISVISIGFEFSQHAEYLIDEGQMPDVSNAARFGRMLTAAYKGPKSSLLSSRKSRLHCAVTCHQIQQCAAMWYKVMNYECEMVGSFMSSGTVQSKQLYVVKSK